MVFKMKKKTHKGNKKHLSVWVWKCFHLLTITQFIFLTLIADDANDNNQSNGLTLNNKQNRWRQMKEKKHHDNSKSMEKYFFFGFMNDRKRYTGLCLHTTLISCTSYSITLNVWCFSNPKKKERKMCVC